MLKKLSVTLATAVLTIGLIAPIAPIVSDVEAKSFGGSRSFSRSSFGSSSRSRPSFSSFKRSSTPKKVTTKAPAKKFTANKGTSGKTAPAKQRSFKSKPVASNPIQARNQRAQFKKPAVTPVSGKRVSRSQRNATYNTKYANNRTYARARSYDSTTYYTRRSAYYGSYSAPVYVYHTSPSFGMWDTIFLYHLLSSNDSSRFAYNHQNDADYIAWRREADRLARDNADLRKQLAAMDAGTSKYVGQSIDPNYLPAGVDADIALSEEARTAQLPELRICVGSRSGAYFKVAAGVIAPNMNNVNVTTVETAGTGEILRNIADGKCDAGFVQGDGYWNYVEDNQTTKLPFERVFSPYRESVHLICHEDGAYDIGDLDSSKTMWFPKNSGAAETWKNFVGENSDYASVKVNTTVGSYEEAALKVSNDVNSCMLYVGAEGATKLMTNINNSSAGNKIVLRDIDDSSLSKTKDPAGSVVYKTSELDEDTYASLLRQGGCWGYCGGDVDTLTVSADFIVSNAWKAQHSKLYPVLAVDLMGLQPRITAVVK